MNKEHLFDLAFSFREAKLWKQLREEELFAVKLSTDDKNETIVYCFVMGTNGQHKALAVYPGVRGFSTFREFCDVLISGSVEPEDVLIQDCMHCSLEQRDQLSKEELAELRAYCRKTDIPARAPFPKFTRYSPFCIPWSIADDGDWNTMETVLRVAEKMAEVIGRAGKAELGLRPVFVSTDGENLEPEQMDLFSDPSPDSEVTIPLFSIENDELAIDRIPLPPYIQRQIAPPKPVDGKTLEKLKQRKQQGVYECELFRYPEPVDGDPPFFPLVLFTVTENGFLLPPSLSKGPMLDPDAMLKDFIRGLNGAHPKAIKVRTEETKALLEGFCRDANILLVMTEELEHIDEALDELFDQMSDDEDNAYDEDDDVDDEDLEDIAAMLSQMSVAQIRDMPEFILDQILDVAEYFPADLIKKVHRAKGKQ